MVAKTVVDFIEQHPQAIVTERAVRLRVHAYIKWASLRTWMR